jgi:pimeloyl-ACP methyl ester carboxylesterase
MLVDLLKLQADFMGARTELAMTLMSSGVLKRVAAVSENNLPVITIPGFLASEASLIRMNRFLNGQGFRAHSWGQGRNLGPQGMGWNQHLDEVGDRLMDRVKAVADQSSAAVALVGQSLGGVYARELAARLESEVDRVIMLGSPTFHPYKDDAHNKVIGRLGSWLNRQTAAEFAGRKGLLHWERDHPALPCVAIHSPIDGVVDENACHIPGYIVRHSQSEAPRENIRVLSSHIGMSVSPWVLLAIADRLATDRDNWRAFNPGEYLPAWLKGGARLVYPNAEELWQDKGTSRFVELHR